MKIYWKRSCNQNVHENVKIVAIIIATRITQELSSLLFVIFLFLLTFHYQYGQLKRRVECQIKFWKCVMTIHARGVRGFKEIYLTF